MHLEMSAISSPKYSNEILCTHVWAKYPHSYKICVRGKMVNRAAWSDIIPNVPFLANWVKMRREAAKCIHIYPRHQVYPDRPFCHKKQKNGGTA